MVPSLRREGGGGRGVLARAEGSFLGEGHRGATRKNGWVVFSRLTGSLRQMKRHMETQGSSRPPMIWATKMTATVGSPTDDVSTATTT